MKELENIINGIKHFIGIGEHDEGDYQFMQQLISDLTTASNLVENRVMPKIAGIVDNLFDIYKHVDFRNGVEYSGMDEGDVKARDIISDLQEQWDKIKTESNFSA